MLLPFPIIEQEIDLAVATGRHPSQCALLVSWFLGLRSP